MPRLLVLTDRRATTARGRTLDETIASAVEGGAHAIVLREKDLPPEHRRHLGEQVAAALASGCRLFVASDVTLARALGADGVHLAASDPPVPRRARAGLVVGRSCHDERDLRAAVDEGLDYVTVSPIHASMSKPGYGPTLGADGLRALTALEHTPPVFALGGVDASRVAECIAAGATGVAAMGAVMAAPEPAAAVAALLAALGEAAPREVAR
jgi:thiamine-phosphate pyrophosphorylase